MTTFRMFLRQIRDPRWIPHISSYCDTRCDRCAFTERCWSYAFRDDPNALPDRLEPENPDDPRWARRFAFDPEAFEPDPTFEKEHEERQQRMKNDPLVRLAHDLCIDMHELLKPFPTRGEPAPKPEGRERATQSLPGSLVDAIDDVRRLSYTIGAKVYRAIGSYEFNKDEQIDNDPIQNDANGSTKVSLLAIEQSLVAWDVIDRAAIIEAGLVGYVIGNLTRLKAGLSERFPLAMAFVRPGFDEEIPGLVRPWSLHPEEDDEDDAATLL
jgi:hypothetical protein